MSQSPTVSDDWDFYGEDGEVEVQVQENGVASRDPAARSPGSDAMQMDESPPSSPEPSTAVKRKLSPAEDEPEVMQKRQKVTFVPERYFSSAVSRTARLPAEAWQHVFLYLTPDSLSCCLRVNKAFYSYLTTLTASQGVGLPARRSGLKLLDSEAIWTSARKTFAPNLPRPLPGFTEMQMFQLLGGQYCQICGAPPAGTVQARSPFDAGPGIHGVRIIWSFGARMCGRCFDATTFKDTEILQSPAAPLRAGLPHAFRTNDLHYIPATTLQANPSGAPRGAMYKVYYRKHIEDLQGEHEEAKEFGDAAAEEWVKGLPLNGKQQMADAARWERWEALHPPGTHPAKTLREYFCPISALPAPVSEETAVEASHAVHASMPPSNGSSLQVLSQQPMKHPLPARVVAVSQTTSQAPTLVHSPPQHDLPSTQNFTQPQPPMQSQQNRPQTTYRPPRNPKEVEDARMARKNEIERRCIEEFYPPLMPNVLQHMESFRAAMIIVTPLTEQAWEVLKPRLLSQRDAAEQIEYQRGEQLRALQATIPDPSYRDTYSKSANEAAERQWEQQQGPVRKKLGKLAEDFIRVKWNNGKSLSRETAPSFAVEVLLYARNQYVDKNTPKEQPIKDGPREPSDPAFVSLENMRWLFDNKVKTLTEKHCRELFMCAECEGVTKGYAFEGMIQHFGAKHTTDFSRGNIVVHWQTADWPDDPPFVPTIGDADPTLPKKQPLQTQYASYGFPPAGVSHASAAGSSIPTFALGQLEHLYAALNNGHVAGSINNSARPEYAAHPPPQSQAARHPAPQPFPYSSYAPAATEPSPSVPQFGSPTVNLYQDQLNEIAKVAKEVWDTTFGVKDMAESVRVETVLYHITKRFKARYNTEPSLDLIADAFANHVLTRPIKNAQPLACKTCVSSSLGSTVYKPYAHRLADNKTYNTSSLIAHFRTVHLIGQDAGAVDWKEDMIEMDDDDHIQRLISSVGMDDEKLATVAEAFPSVFRQPLPSIGKITEHEEAANRGPVDFSNSPRSAGNFNKFNKKDRRKKNKRGLPRHGVDDHDEGEQSDMPEAGEDEYDPRRPAFIDSAAHGRSISGGRRSFGGPTGNGHANLPNLDSSVLTPETLAALSKLAPTLNLGSALARNGRSPSIPRVGVVANEAAYRANQRATYHPHDPAANHTAQVHQPENEKRHLRKDRNDRNKTRNRRSGAGVSGGDSGPDEPEEDYTQVIRTAPANNGDYSLTSLAQHPGAVPAVSPNHYAADRPAPGRSQHPDPAGYKRVALDQYGRPVPIAEPPYRYEERERVQYVDEYGRPVQYAPPPPREEIQYVDIYGRPVEVVRVVDRPVYDRPVYNYPPDYVQPPSGHEYAAPPPGHEYDGPPPVHEYSRQPEMQYERRSDRVQYVDDYGRPIQYAPAPY